MQNARDTPTAEAKDLQAGESDRLVATLLRNKDVMQRFSRAVGCADDFSVKTIELLRDAGALLAPLPTSGHGLGWGTEPVGTAPLATALRIIGSASLAVGRIYEAHVNAVALIAKFARPAVREAAWADVRDGHLFGLWVASGAEPVRLSRCGSSLRLIGTKPFCTAAGFVTRSIITFTCDDGQEQMVLLDAGEGRIEPTFHKMHGMRNTATRPVSFDQDHDEAQCIGQPGDYFAEPDFTAGAWRTSAVTAGGLRSLVDETITQLHATRRDRDPHQSRRIGLMLIQCETARMWAEAAALRTVVPNMDSGDITTYVNLARTAVEQVCLDAIPLVQRSLGLKAMMMSNPVEALIRDLATYLRQPAGDEILSEAAMHVAQRGLSVVDGYDR